MPVESVLPMNGSVMDIKIAKMPQMNKVNASCFVSFFSLFFFLPLLTSGKLLYPVYLYALTVWRQRSPKLKLITFVMNKVLIEH